MLALTFIKAVTASARVVAGGGLGGGVASHPHEELGVSVALERVLML